MTWRPGDTAVFRCQFDVSSVFTDPSTIELLVKNPEGSTAHYRYSEGNLTRTAAGKYEREVSLDKEGAWKWRWVGTGNCAAADEGHFSVRSSVFT